MEQEAQHLKGLAERIAALSPEQRAIFSARLGRSGSPGRSGSARIPLAPRKSPIPLSYAQQRLWFLDQLDPASTTYNVPFAIRFVGSLRVQILEQALGEIMKRHESLRSCFPSNGARPEQVISPFCEFTLPLIDLAELPPEQSAERAMQLATNEARKPFDLSRGPLIRATLVRLSDDEHVLVIVMHHIICDGWSLSVLARELGAFYTAFLESEPPAIPELPIQYADFAVWQREWLQGKVLENQLSYWRGRLAVRTPPLELPADRPRPAKRSFLGDRQVVTIPAILSESLKDFSRREGVTLYMTLLAVFQTLLYRYTNLDDISVGTPIANRTSSEIEPLIGFFVNTLVMRVNMAGDPTFRELLSRVKESALGAYAHQDLPFEKLVEELQPDRTPGHSPFFDVTFALQNTPATEIRLPGLHATIMKVDNGTAKFDLSLLLTEEASGIRASATYATDLFDAATVRRMLGHFQVLAEAVAHNPDQRLSELPLLTSAERREILGRWNDTDNLYPRESRLEDLFAAQVRKNPNAPAVKCNGRQLTYRELDRKGNRLANRLKNLGIGPKGMVGILAERSLEMIVGVLGVLKAGAAYVPFDPAYPLERTKFMIEDAGISVLLTTEGWREKAPANMTEVIIIEQETPAESDEVPISNKVCAEDTALVMYTSGSSGRPKGVAIPHRAVTRLVINTNYISFEASDCVAHASNVSFDAATFEIWGALLHGAVLVIIPRDALLTPRELADLLREEKISVLFLTTALFHQFARLRPTIFSGVRHLLFGGEVANPQLARRVLESGESPQRLINVYGPTESTTFATWYPITNVSPEANSIPIGRPISNTQVYLLDSHLKPVPIGVTGEIYIGGDGLAFSYLNRVELTEERFINITLGEGDGGRLYRTGDLARYQSDGNLHFIGRVDDQIKLRGFRVELGEIEVAIREHPGVAAATVIAKEDARKGDKRLVGYFVGSPQNIPSPEEVRGGLKKRLPEYMVPTELVRLEALPLTPNGKVDRQALPVPEQRHSGPEKSYVAPRDTIEHQLAHIWEEVLGLPNIGIKDNFFELGGHSLLAVRLMARIEQACGRKLPLSTLFTEATIEHLAQACLSDLDRNPQPEFIRVNANGTLQPFFFLHGDYDGGGFYCLELARHVGEDQPLFVLPPLGVRGQAAPSTVEEMAVQHLKTLRQLQPEGPYLLGGFCHGGLIAFEMARRLITQGQNVDLLVMVHTSGKNAGQASLRRFIGLISRLLLLPAEKELEWFIRSRQFLQRFKELPPTKRGFFVLNKVKKLKNVFRLLMRRVGFMQAGSLPPGQSQQSGETSVYLRHSEELYRRYYMATHGYVPGPYTGRVTLFWPDEVPTESIAGPAHGWDRVAKDIEVHTIKGTHLSCLTKHVKIFARELKTCLQNVCAPH